VEVNGALMFRSNAFLLGEVFLGRPEGNAAEVIVMSHKPEVEGLRQIRCSRRDNVDKSIEISTTWPKFG